MSKVIAFVTPGTIPLRAFTILGMTAKPNTKTPIGFFGTGLKYAVAVCLRHKCPVTMYRQGVKYEFYSKLESFRDKEFETIKLRRSRGVFARETELPFTTEYGKTWELWQAFRELYANTVDENGFTAEQDSSSFPGAIVKDYTYIVVEGQKFVDEFWGMDKTFLPNAIMERTQDSTGVQIFQGRPSKHVYYRGMRVHDLQEPSENTYNILDTIDLTEDRTAKYSFQIDEKIAYAVKGSTDENLISRVLKAPKGSFERKLTYTYAYNAPSKVFLDVAQSLGDKVSEGVAGIVLEYRPKAKLPRPKLELYPRLVEIGKALELGDYSAVEELIEQDKAEFMDNYNTMTNEIMMAELNASRAMHTPPLNEHPSMPMEEVDDDMPF